MDYRKLRGAIYSRHKSIAAFARDIGWTRQKLHNIVNGQYLPNTEEVKTIRKGLNLTRDEATAIFLPDQP